MKTSGFISRSGLIVFTILSVTACFRLFVGASTYYVNANNINPAPPFATWDNAATNIQDAIEVATNGDYVIVTNGVYDSGGQPVNGYALTNRVAVTKAVTIQSVNGPDFTMIMGYQNSVTTNGDDAVRCVYLTNKAALIGFTLSGGATRTNNGDWYGEQIGGGAWCEDATAVISNCVVSGNVAGDSGGGVYGGTLKHCVIVSNAVPSAGGGAYQSMMENCILAGNRAGWGGGGFGSFWWDTRSCILRSCMLTNNFSGAFAGGTYGGILDHCQILNNTVTNATGDSSSGGADSAELDVCVVTGNVADYGGGAQSCNVNNCIITNNAATQYGGGVRASTVINSTVLNNSAGVEGGGADAAELDNSIVYFNSAPTNANFTAGNCVFNNSCTTPMPDNGLGNIIADPLLTDLAAGNLRLLSNSPCVNLGNNGYVTNSGAVLPQTYDFDGSQRIQGLYVDAGAFEFSIPAAITADYTNVAVGYPVHFYWQLVAGNVMTCTIDFGDGTIVTNPVTAVHQWLAAGDHTVTLAAVSDQFPAGVTAQVVVHVYPGLYYVSAQATNPIAPFTAWEIAATNIQDAVEAAVQGGTVVVADGIYGFGGRVVFGALTNRVVAGKSLTIQSVNGPQVTIIQGQWDPASTNGDSAVRGVYLTNKATLSGFTVRNGATRDGAGNGQTEQCGGGIYCETTNCLVTNCIISGNAANNSGGGAYGGTYLNCVITGNTANGSGGGLGAAGLVSCTVMSNFCSGNGGGANACTFSNCLILGNTSYNPSIWNGGGGGGVHDSTLRQCTLAFNNGYGGGGAQHCTLDNCLIATNSVTRPRCGGGGIENSIASHCTIIGNHSEDVGGGVDYSALTNCLVINNQAEGDGGGFWGGWGYNTLYNCLIAGNSAGGQGGGVNDAYLYNCTVVNNYAAQGGGVFSCNAYNSIIFHNDAAYQENHIYSYFENCSTVPMPVYGTNNFTTDPQLADNYHLSAASPCRLRGNPVYATGTDFDGKSWASPPDIGCDQFVAGADTGALAVSIEGELTTFAASFSAAWTASITGHAGANRWDFGDGIIATNQPVVMHRWSTPGDYTITLTAFNSANQGGVTASQTVHVMTPPAHYVSLTSANPSAPYNTWETAATNIQDAIDASTMPGARIVVSNGVYSTGGRVVFGILTNRVAAVKPVALESVNGAAATVILGNPSVSDSGIRCLWLTNGSSIRGFTIASGGTRSWQGDEPREISGGGIWCNSINIAVADCIISNNFSEFDGAGMVGGTVSNCVFMANSSGDSGGGIAGGRVTHCWFTNNVAFGGCGVWGSLVENSFFVGNSEIVYSWGGRYGEGASESEVHNTLFYGNKNAGADNCALFNCSVIANTGIGVGGQSLLQNCIAYYNFDRNGNVANYSGQSWLDHCCVTPLPGNGSDNISSAPQLSDWFHLTAASPCVGAGLAASATGVDIDGEAWQTPPAIGADEYHPGAYGTLTVSLNVAYTNVAVGFNDALDTLIVGHASACIWNFGDGTSATNQLSVTHSWLTPGDYVVSITAYNDDNPAGVSASLNIHVETGHHYVARANPNPMEPYDSWLTAATNVQDAITVAPAGGDILVSNGVYQSGWGMGGGTSNLLAAVIPLTIRSVNGPLVTVLEGGGTIRCAYLTNQVLLSGFTLQNGAGGGVAGQSSLAVVTNCLVLTNSGTGISGCSVFNSYIAGNIAYNGGGAANCQIYNSYLTGNTANGQYGEGGGAFRCNLYSCVLSNNTANGEQGGGGGAAEGTVYNCLVTGNSGKYSGGLDMCTAYNCTIVSNSVGGQSWSWGGGAGNSDLRNSIIYFNSGPSAPNVGYSSSASYCCTPDNIPNAGNFTNAPLFINPPGGDYHLQSSSPCINAGNSAWVFTGSDFDGNPRVVGSAVDVGAFEFPSPASVISYAWMQQYGLPTDGTADFADPDGDGMNNWQEWKTGTNPTNALSLLKIVSVTRTNSANGIIISWQSVAGLHYFLQRGSDLRMPLVTLQSDIAGQNDTTSFSDLSATNAPTYFYRVGVP